MPNTHFLDYPSRRAQPVNVCDRTSLGSLASETVQSQNRPENFFSAPPNRSQFESVSRDTRALSPVKTPTIPPVISRDICVILQPRRDAGDDQAGVAVTLSPLIEALCVLIGLAMAVPLAAVVWAVGP